MTGDIDDEFAEVIDTVGPRRRQSILDAAIQVAADIRADAELLGTSAVSDSNRDDPACSAHTRRKHFGKAGSGGTSSLTLRHG